MDRSFPIALLLLGLVLLLAGGAWGGTSARDGYTLSGMAGQADASVSAGDGYTLSGGFWPGGEVAPVPVQKVYLPIVQTP
jgi:hypothetical protein